MEIFSCEVNFNQGNTLKSSQMKMETDSIPMKGDDEKTVQVETPQEGSAKDGQEASESDSTISEETQQSLAGSSTNILLTSSENTNNENREKEMLIAQKENVENIESLPREKNDGEEPKTSGNRPVDDEYSKYVTYNEDGKAIYTDPQTNFQYEWCTESNAWKSLDSSTDSSSSERVKNPYENEHYRWCTKTNQWIPKNTPVSSSASDSPSAETISKTDATEKSDTETSSQTETEFYKWDEKSRKWIPKMGQGQLENATYNYEDGVHTYTDRDGAIYFWDTEKNAWFPKIDDDFMARYQLNYGFIDNTSTSSSNIENKPLVKKSFEELEKEAEEATAAGEDNEITDATEKIDSTAAKGLKRKIPTEPPKWFDLPPEQNTKVYVSNLPLDVTEEEFVQVMSKCGLIMRDPNSQKYKIKLYTDGNGQLKGDGLCDYIKVESVELALQLLDGYDVRGHTIKVQRAKFEMRGEYNPALKPKRKKKDKEKLKKMKEKLFDWRPDKMRGERSKHERVVIIKNLFSPELFDKEVHLIIDYQNDLREECGKCGTVRKVLLYDRHPEGVGQVTMSEPEEADLVVQMMHGRYFGQRKLTAEIWDGKTKFKIAETDAEVKKRLSDWNKYLETSEDNKERKPTAIPEQDENVDKDESLPTARECEDEKDVVENDDPC